MSYKTLNSINTFNTNRLSLPLPIKNFNSKENFVLPRHNYITKKNIIRENFLPPTEQNFSSYNDKENFVASTRSLETVSEDMYPKVNPNFIAKNDIQNIKTESKNLNINYEIVDSYSTVSPPIFGPPLWFSLHNAAAHYPDNPSPITKDRMKHIILGIPVLTPCSNCSEHASAYIESHYDDLDKICSGRDPLFKFFVDFHNYVNKRYNKPIMSYEDAYKLYLGNAKVTRMTYS